jgi:GTPase Era involved in 16S rRNA processing
VPFGLSRADRSRHVYAVGQTGVGKSTLIFNMAVQDIRRSRERYGMNRREIESKIRRWRGSV